MFIFLPGVANNKKKISARKKILESDNDNDDDDEGEKTEDSQGAGSAGPAAGQDVEMDTASPVAGPSGIRRSQVNIFFSFTLVECERLIRYFQEVNEVNSSVVYPERFIDYSGSSYVILEFRI